MKHLNRFISVLAEFFNTMKDEVLITDHKGKILFVNLAFSRSSGYSLADIKGKLAVKNIIDEDFLSKALKLRKDERISTSVNFKNKKKERMTRTANAFVLSYPDVDLTNVLIVMENQTAEHIQLTKELAESVLLKIINFREDAIWFSGDVMAYRIPFISESVKAILGWDREHFISGGWMVYFSLVHPEDLPSLLMAYKKWLNDKNTIGQIIDHVSFRHAVRLRARTDEYVLLEVESNVQLRKNGKVHLIFGSYRPTLKEEESMYDAIRQFDGKTYVDLDYIKQLKEKSGNSNSPKPELTPREHQVLKLVADGFSSNQIADKLHLSIHTINMHRRQVMLKFHAKNLADMIKKYISMDFV